MMKVAIVGTGYVGLVSATCFAEIGHEVTCVDVDITKVDAINHGEAPIYEIGLDEGLARNVAAGRLRATTDLADAVRGAELTMIAVGTPFDGARIDLQYIRTAARQIGEALRDLDSYHVVCVKSTVLPGTTADVVGPIVESSSGRTIGHDLGLGMNPEFLREGQAVVDFMSPDRVVIGAADDRSAECLRRLYAPMGDVDTVVTTPGTAEAIKYTANAFFATLISFSNEIANVCSSVGDIDVVDVLEGVYLDRRISPVTDRGRIRPELTSFLFPGVGFGGSCFPKDVRSLITFGVELGLPMSLLGATMAVNDSQRDRLVDAVRHAAGSSDITGRRVSVLGLAFKPDTDDVRESPSIPLVEALVGCGATVTVHDPIALDNGLAALAGLDVTAVDEVADAVDGADIVVIMTKWPQYRAVPELIADRTDPPVVIDGRRMLAPESVERYVGTGLRRLP